MCSQSGNEKSVGGGGEWRGGIMMMLTAELAKVSCQQATGLVGRGVSKERAPGKTYKLSENVAAIS